MPESQDRKPQPPTPREPAQNLLNKFLQENNILVGTDKPDIDVTNKGQVIVSAPRVIAVYADELGAPAKPSN